MSGREKQARKGSFSKNAKEVKSSSKSSIQKLAKIEQLLKAVEEGQAEVEEQSESDSIQNGLKSKPKNGDAKIRPHPQTKNSFSENRSEDGPRKAKRTKAASEKRETSKKGKARSSIDRLAGIEDLMKRIEAGQAAVEEIDSMDSSQSQNGSASQQKDVVRHHVEIAEDFQGRRTFDPSKKYVLFAPESLPAYLLNSVTVLRGCTNPTAMELHKAITNGDLLRECYKIETMKSLMKYLFYLCSSTTDSKLLFAAKSTFHHFSSMKRVLWSPSPSDVLAVVVNQGGNRNLMSQTSDNKVFEKVELPKWVDQRLANSQKSSQSTNGSHSQEENGRHQADFEENLIWVVRVISDCTQRHKDYSGCDIVQLIHILTRIASSKRHCDKGTLHTAITKTISALLGVIDEGTWSSSKAKLVKETALYSWEGGNATPHEVLFRCQMLGTCGTRGLHIVRCLAFMCIQQYLGDGPLDENPSPVLKTVTAYLIRNASDLHRNADPYRVWVAVQLIGFFVMNEPLPAEERENLRSLRQWMVQEASKIRDKLERPDLIKVKNEMMNLITLWEVFLNCDMKRQPTITRYLKR